MGVNIFCGNTFRTLLTLHFSVCRKYGYSYQYSYPTSPAGTHSQEIWIFRVKISGFVNYCHNIICLKNVQKHFFFLWILLLFKFYTCSDLNRRNMIQALNCHFKQSKWGYLIVMNFEEMRFDCNILTALCQPLENMFNFKRYVCRSKYMPASSWILFSFKLACFDDEGGIRMGSLPGVLSWKELWSGVDLWSDFLEITK